MAAEQWVSENSDIRLDLDLFRSPHGQCVMEMWADNLKLHPWFQIPHVIKILCSFARDNLDALYVDEMERFVELASRTDVRLYRNDVPLCYLPDCLLGRRWNQFSKVTGFVKAINRWRAFRLFVHAEDLIFKDHDDKRFHCAV